MKLLPSKIMLPNLAALLCLRLMCNVWLCSYYYYYTTTSSTQQRCKTWTVVKKKEGKGDWWWEETWVTVFLVGEGTTRWRHRWSKAKGHSIKGDMCKRAWYGEKSIRNPGQLMMSHTQKEHKEGVVGPGKREKEHSLRYSSHPIYYLIQSTCMWFVCSFWGDSSSSPRPCEESIVM